MRKVKLWLFLKKKNYEGSNPPTVPTPPTVGSNTDISAPTVPPTVLPLIPKVEGKVTAISPYDSFGYGAEEDKQDFLDMFKASISYRL